MFRKLGHPSLLVAPVFVYPTQLVHAQSVETGRHSRPPTTRNIDEGERVALTGNTHRDARTLRRWAPRLCAALLLLGWPMRGYSQTAVATIPAGANPLAAAVNPVTNKIYVANKNSNNVTVIDGANPTKTPPPPPVPAGTNPAGVAVNPVTNKIYVANQGSNN